MKKGLELPINMIVVIAIAVLVLVVVAAVFSGNFLSGTNTITAQVAWANGCNQARARGCAVNDFGTLNVAGYDPDGDKVDNTLLSACQAVFGSDYTVATCKAKCC
ncbi:hypothetical protein HYZ41_03320 [archaeon]|nr:hypothetical protein [archaeon]